MNVDLAVLGLGVKKPRRGIKKAPVNFQKLQELECREAIKAWLRARLVVIPEGEWAEKTPHERPRVRNADLIANADEDPARGKAEKRGWMFTPPGYDRIYCMIEYITIDD